MFFSRRDLGALANVIPFEKKLDQGVSDFDEQCEWDDEGEQSDRDFVDLTDEKFALAAIEP